MARWMPSLEVYHKGIVPTIQISLTIAALIVAWQVLGVNLQNAERSNKELGNRIEKLTAFSKTLEKQNDDLAIQSQALESIIQVVFEGYDLAEEQNSHASKNMTRHMIQVAFRAGNTTNLLSKVSTYNDDERLLLTKLSEMCKADLDLTNVLLKLEKETDKERTRLRAKRDEAIKKDPSQKTIIVVQYIRDLQNAKKHIAESSEKEVSSINGRMLTLTAAANELAKGIGKIKK